MKQHTYEEHVSCSVQNCPICDGGLALCVVCHCGEGTLTTECSGMVVPMVMQDLIHAGKLDYDGRWIEVPCKTCDGTGQVHSHNPSCWDCKGNAV